MVMETYYVIPTNGVFKITVTPYNDPRTNKLSYYVLNVGGDIDKCVNITIHSEDSKRSKELLLSWTEVIGKECSVDGQLIKGDSTVQMVRLAFTVAKEIAPYAEYITFSDMSYFMCNTPEGNIKVSLPAFHIAFYDKTWYEDKFKAIMTNANNYKLYRDSIENMYNEDTDMPPDFDFGNARIRELLLPFYTKAKTWKQFFHLIAVNYPDDKCTLMYPWLTGAMRFIFQGSGVYAGQEWKIDIKKIVRVKYYQVDKSHIKGGGFKKEYRIQCYDYRDINYSNTMNWDIDTFLKRRKYTCRKRNGTNRTRKNRLWSKVQM